MDYGHPLEFGAFITPASGAPERVLELSLLAEQLGFDVLTFQDHPYRASLLDTWTLLSYVAACTTRIRLAPNVINVPLRHPAVLARSAASLDLLSSGRIELGLGAGGYWDSIVSLGGERLTQGQAATGLEEAIAIIRGIWDVESPDELTIVGRYHRVASAERGPAPAHPIPILIGAYKPRMLDLVGRVADGWSPGQPSLTAPALPEANRIIDDAALAAGRDPRAVRRLLTIRGRSDRDSREWARELAALTLEQGVSLFIVASDEARVLQTFAEEVAPLVRDLVGTGRLEPGHWPAG